MGGLHQAVQEYAWAQAQMLHINWQVEVGLIEKDDEEAIETFETAEEVNRRAVLELAKAGIIVPEHLNPL